MDAKSATTRPRLSHRVGALVDGFETIVYATAFLLLVAAAVLVVMPGTLRRRTATTADPVGRGQPKCTPWASGNLVE
jgi:hypothetical protein